MEKLPPLCTGGIVEYIADHVDGLNWQGISIQCSLFQKDPILLFGIMCLTVTVLCASFLSDRSFWRVPLCYPRPNPLPSPANGHFAANLNQGMIMSDIVKPIDQSSVMDLQICLPSNNPNDTVLQKLATLIDSSKLPSHSTNDKVCSDEPKICPPSAHRSIPIQFFLAILEISIVLALVMATIYACFIAQRIQMTVFGLKDHVVEVASSTKLLTNTFISEAYAIMNHAIEEDVAQNNSNSRLRPFVEEMKLIWGDQAMRLYAMAMKHTPSRTWLRQQTRINLHHFNTLLRRLSSLFAVAPHLNESSIKSANDLFLTYSYELARLTPHPMFKPSSWRNTQILNFTASTLCRHNTTHFPTCSDVESHFATMVSKLEAWPIFEKSRDFTRATAYSLLPRMLNAEAQVEKWLPLAQDPTGKIPFLFDEFLVREIAKESRKLNISLEHLPQQWTNSSARKYLGTIATIPIVLTVTLVLLEAVLVFVYLPISNIHCFCGPPQGGYKKIGRNQRRTSFCLQMVALFTVTLCINGAVFGIIGSIGQSQLCDVLLTRTQHSDVWLNHMLARIVLQVPYLRELLDIENIHVQFPERVFSTFNTNYTSTSPPFLQSINMNRPVNLSALLHSKWLNKTLYDLWYKDIFRKMSQANMSYHIPRVPLSKTFNHFREAFKLDQTFDNLNVGNITEYLPEPSEDYYTRIGLALQTISRRESKELEQLANYFIAIGDVIAMYKLKFDQIAQALVVIEKNRKILEPLSPLVDVGDKIIGYLANKSNTELISHFTNNTAEIFINSKASINQYVLPIIHQILDRLLPYPHLRHAYRKALSPICPTETNSSPLFLSLKSFGFTLSLSAFGLFTVCFLCNRINRPFPGQYYDILAFKASSSLPSL